MGSTTIAKRVQRLRLPKAEVARLASLHENTVARALSPVPRSQVQSLRKIEVALDAEELALRDYLLELHPLTVPGAAA